MRSEYIAGLRRRHDAAQRLIILDCGCSDPWPCRHFRESASEASEAEVDAYHKTALLLLAEGYTPAPDIRAMRALWRRGGAARDVVRRISERWEIAA
jgi:hypothetical protein